MSRRRQHASEPSPRLANRGGTSSASSAKATVPRSSAFPNAVGLPFMRHRGLIAGVLVLLVLGTGAFWWLGPRAGRAPLPSLDLRSVDAKVAATLTRHLDAVKSTPRSGAAWGRLGALLWAYDFRPQAGQCLDQAERLDPANPRWPYYHGLALLISSPGEAAPQFRRAARLCGNDPEAPRFRLARILAEQGRWDEARSELDQLLKAKPDFAPARLLSARAAQARGEVARAIELARGCTTDPRSARSAWALLAILYRQQGDPAGATNAVQRAAAMAPDEGFGDPFEAEATLLRGDPRALSEQAHPLLAAGHVKEAAGLIDRLLRDHATYPDTWLLAGRLQLLRKDYSAAEKALRHYLELSPQSAQGLFQLGLVMLAQNRFPEAADIFGRTTQLKPDFGPAYFNRGFALARAGQRREAMAAFRESLRHNPEHLESYLLLADLHLQVGEQAAARELLNQADAVDPKHPRLKALKDRVARGGQ